MRDKHLAPASGRRIRLRFVPESRYRMKLTKFALFALLLALLAPGSARAAAPRTAAEALTGYWFGKLSFGPNQMRLLIEVSASADGAISGKLSNVDFGNSSSPVSAILFNDPDVRFEVEGMGGAINGKLSEDASVIKGTFSFGFKPVKVTFTHSKEPPKETLKKEFSYDVAEGAVDVKGYWGGALELPGMKLSMLVKIGKADDGSYGGALDVPDQGARDIPITTVTRTNAEVVLEWKMFNARFKGTMNDKATELDGTWEQMGKTTPLKLSRSKPPADPNVVADKELSFVPPAGKADVNGFWLGTLKVPNASLRLGFKIGRRADGTYRGAVDSLDQGASDLPISSVGFTNPVVRLEFRSLNGSFEGTLTNNNQTLIGTWQQGQMKNDLILERLDKPATSDTAAAK